MYASFLNLPVEGRHSRALYLELFTVPSPLMTFCETISLTAPPQIHYWANSKGKASSIHHDNRYLAWPDLDFKMNGSGKPFFFNNLILTTKGLLYK
jgi:hypothetical protein